MDSHNVWTKQRGQVTWVNPDRGELFFAKRVILVEGDTERVALPFLAEMIGCADPTVSVIDCGSKQSMPLYIKVLNAFSIEYAVIFDEDPDHDGCMYDIAEPALMPSGLNKRIVETVQPELGQYFVCKDGFETFSEIPQPSGKRANKNKPMKAVEHFSSVLLEDLPHQLISLVQKAYGAN